jgi:hypothetical protein
MTLSSDRDAVAHAAVLSGLAAALSRVQQLEPEAGDDWDSDTFLIKRSCKVRKRDPEALNELVEALRADAWFSALEGCSVSTYPGSSHRHIDLNDLAEFLVAQVLLYKDAARVLIDFINFVQTGEREVISVVTLPHVEIDEPVVIEDVLQLTCIECLPPSTSRDAALGRPGPMFSYSSRVGPMGLPATAALAIGGTIGPVICRTSDVSGSARAHSEKFLNGASYVLWEALNCVSLAARNYVRGYLSWSSFVSTHFGIDGVSGLGFGDSSHMLPVPIKIDTTKFRRLASAYFSIDWKIREKHLAIPMDRLNRARGARDLTDAFIELGIALEALLLSDQQGDRELSYRLVLRGALLESGDLAQRQLTIKLLKNVYRLRSMAVHNGRVPADEKNREILESGREICSKLLENIIDRGGKVDFAALELGQ